MTITENIETKEDGISLIKRIMSHLNLEKDDIFSISLSNNSKQSTYIRICSFKDMQSMNKYKNLFPRSNTIPANNFPYAALQENQTNIFYRTYMTEPDYFPSPDHNMQYYLNYSTIRTHTKDNYGWNVEYTPSRQEFTKVVFYPIFDISE